MSFAPAADSAFILLMKTARAAIPDVSEIVRKRIIVIALLSIAIGTAEYFWGHEYRFHALRLTFDIVLSLIVFADSIRLIRPQFKLWTSMGRLIAYACLLIIITVLAIIPVYAVATVVLHSRFLSAAASAVVFWILGARFMFMFVLAALDEIGKSPVGDSWALSGGSALGATLLLSGADDLLSFGLGSVTQALPSGLSGALHLLFVTFLAIVFFVITVRWLAVCEQLLAERRIGYARN